MDQSAEARDGLSKRCQDLAVLSSLVPGLFHRQHEIPDVVGAEQALIAALLATPEFLSQAQQRALLHSVASVWQSQYCLNLFGRPGPPSTSQDAALLRFGSKLARFGLWFSHIDVEDLAASGFAEAAIVQAVSTVAIGHFLCTLAESLAPGLDNGLETVLPLPEATADHPEWKECQGPYIPMPLDLSETLQPSFRTLVGLFGFVPGLIRIQAIHPRIVVAQVGLLEALLGSEEHLSQVQKQQILMALSARNCNSYLVAVHAQILNLLGVQLEDCDRIVESLEQAPLLPRDRILLQELTRFRIGCVSGRTPVNMGLLRSHGFSDAQIVEGVTVAALANLLAAVQFGLGPVPDFPLRRVFAPNDLHPSQADFRRTPKEPTIDDPDSALVGRVKSGDADAFEALVRLHSRRVFCALFGLLGNAEDARDATQDVFLKAYQHIGSFESRSRFSTWVTSIAINTGRELLRRRRPSESLDDDGDDLDFRPRQIQSWIDNPEQSMAKAEVDNLVRASVLRLPEKYRVAVLLRDINQLPTEEAAVALGLSIPALKARVLRGRLMLREALAPHFNGSRGARDV